jgi:hypothetical protein
MALSGVVPSDLSRKTFPALVVALPCALWAVHHSLGHEGDIGFFYDWYLAFRQGAGFYGDGPGLNYPIVGVLLVCGPSTLAELVVGHRLDAADFRLVLKATLVAGEVAFVFAAAALAQVLRAPRPRWLALALWALPATWAGGAWFGQTDVWNSALLLTSAWALVRYRRDGRGRDLAIGLVALHTALLSKQLTWFAAPGLGLLALLGLRRHGTPASWALALASPLLWLAPDPWLALPDGDASHLWFVLAHGSTHGELAVASGASVWALFYPGGTLASQVTFAGLSSFAWGWLAWAAAMAAALVRQWRHRLSSRSLVAFAGLGHLAMATLLTGVHERYLAHAIPLLILADACAPLWRRAFGWIVGCLAGAFVLATIHGSFFTGPLALLAHPAPLALTALGWLIVQLVDPNGAGSLVPEDPLPSAPLETHSEAQPTKRA